MPKLNNRIFTSQIRDPLSKARQGRLRLPRGCVETPAFMPVGTMGAVKAITPPELLEMGFRLILSNAYHLYLRPGEQIMARAGGLHKLSAWPANILTDSGGFQIFSLAPFKRLSRKGARFRSHIDGSCHELTPEKVVEWQRLIGSDIMMPLDVCTGFSTPFAQAREAVEITTDWAKRSLRAWQDADRGEANLLFGIVQGNFYPELRRQSAAEITGLDFPGFAIGGLSVGEPRPVFGEYLRITAPLLPEDKVRYVMGIGTPDYILEAVENGCDIFDCVWPTRIARNGVALTENGPLTLKQARFRQDWRPLEKECFCPVCQNYSRAWLRHLFKAKEILASVLLTRHNLTFMATFMEKIRHSLTDGRFTAFKKDFLASYGSGVPL